MDQRPPDDVNREVEYLLSQTHLAQRVPLPVRRQIDRALRRDDRPALVQILRAMDLKKRFGVGERALHAYARQVRALDCHALQGEIIRGFASLLATPLECDRQLLERGQALVLARLAQVLQQDDLPPAELPKLADAVAKALTASARLQAQRLAERRFERQAAAARPRLTPEQEDAELAERVRRIYGITIPDEPAAPEPPRGNGGQAPDTPSDEDVASHDDIVPQDAAEPDNRPQPGQDD